MNLSSHTSLAPIPVLAPPQPQPVARCLLYLLAVPLAHLVYTIYGAAGSGERDKRLKFLGSRF